MFLTGASTAYLTRLVDFHSHDYRQILTEHLIVSHRRRWLDGAIEQIS